SLPNPEGSAQHNIGCSDSGRVEVEQSPGHFISVYIGMQFAIRQEATLHLKNFAKLSGGTVTVSACSVKPKAQLRFVRFDRSVATSDYDCFVSSLKA
ncbi:hypothetical protein JG687_00000839, partial [Phytophthora cactorum]